jgi:tRNA(Ile)-lysidine synthase
LSENLSAAEFAARMAALGPFEIHPHLAVAVSGGSDSMATALLADTWARERGGRVTALTVDHGLRDGAAAEARRVGGWL